MSVVDCFERIHAQLGLKPRVGMGGSALLLAVQHLQRLIVKQEIKASRYAGRNGVPAYLPAKHFAALMALTRDAGARELLKHARYEELQGGELDVDTVEDMASARELF